MPGWYEEAHARNVANLVDFYGGEHRGLIEEAYGRHRRRVEEELTARGETWFYADIYVVRAVDDELGTRGFERKIMREEPAITAP